MQNWVVVHDSVFCTEEFKMLKLRDYVLQVFTNYPEAMQFARDTCNYGINCYSDSEVASSGRVMEEINDENGEIKLLVFNVDDIDDCEAWLAHKWR